MTSIKESETCERKKTGTDTVHGVERINFLIQNKTNEHLQGQGGI